LGGMAKLQRVTMERDAHPRKWEFFLKFGGAWAPWSPTKEVAAVFAEGKLDSPRS
jgi:hypothetical protein